MKAWGNCSFQFLPFPKLYKEKWEKDIHSGLQAYIYTSQLYQKPVILAVYFITLTESSIISLAGEFSWVILHIRFSSIRRCICVIFFVFFWGGVSNFVLWILNRKVYLQHEINTALLYVLKYTYVKDDSVWKYKLRIMTNESPHCPSVLSLSLMISVHG